ncbi:hypothetical protein PR202_ga21562 [Eleusine coracana subsp. coracana]|uniref:DOMON domain-containing protein n=1 Tax=Eleusine coracana subsp. coracana TaxID=191504 RepID=A0AAV5CZZ3_ELECO|nr:hypothetical protein QOZ80_8AG0637900 [Eleusine coracana subsp. coracana]GJN04052.1 hypothetical protein PR202_ga21562 [Eleusine coracana subsp. coracana]
MAPHLALLLLLLSAPAAPLLVSAAIGACSSEKFPAGRTFQHCEDLPKLGASIHWTHDASTNTLSVAFVAAPASPGGWVAWGLNPTAEGMTGTQALVALKGGASGGAPAVKTYNITGYVPLGAASTPIAFPATDLAADAAGAGGRMRVYGKLQLHKGMRVVNQVWQVGSSVTGGAPDKHAFAADNLAAKSKLVLAGKAAASGGAPTPAAAPVAGGPAAGSSGNESGAAASPAAGKSPSAAVASAGVSAPAVIVMALVGFLATVW